MTGQERDYEAILSRVLQTTTDQLEPVGDGLTKIRERLSEPWLQRQWWLLRSEFMVHRWLVVARFESFYGTLKSRSAAADPAPADPAADPLAPLIACSTAATPEHAGRLRSLRSALGGVTAWVAAMGPGRGTKGDSRSLHGPLLNWLRPALAVAGAVVLVVAGVFAFGNIQQGFGLIGLGADGGGSQPGTSSHANANGNTNGGGGHLHGAGSPSQGRSGATSAGTATGHHNTTPSPGPCRSASLPPPSPSPSPSPTSATPTPSPSTSPTPTPSPSPSTSTSQGPLIGYMPGHTQEAIGTTALVKCEPTAGPQPSPSNQAPSPT